jgi:hypothetical protein
MAKWREITPEERDQLERALIAAKLKAAQDMREQAKKEQSKA